MSDTQRALSPTLSDTDLPEFEAAKQEYEQYSKNREMEIEERQECQRKVRRLAAASHLSGQLGEKVDKGKQRFWAQYEDAAVEQAQGEEGLVGDDDEDDKENEEGDHVDEDEDEDEERQKREENGK